MSGAHSGTRERWRHAWAAFVLGAIAAIALGLVAFVLSTQRAPTPEARGPMLLTEVPSSPSAAPSTSAPRAISATRSSPTASITPPARTTPAALTTTPPSASAHAVLRPSPPAAQQPCGTSAPCIVGGTGEVQDALAAYRHAHGGAGMVPAVVTPAAQRCAETGGDGSSCADPFAVAREQQQSGHQAVGDIASGYGNWLLEPNLHAVEVGWAYDPRTRQYVCVLIARM